MRFDRVGFVVVMAPVLVLATVSVILACFSSPVPPTCARTIFLAKFAPGSVVLPATGTVAPVGVVPFVSWDVGNPAGCAQPTSAEVVLTLACTPTGGGAAFTLGPQTFATTTPAVPGAQPVPGGALPFAVPAGTVPATCTVMGTYTVGFGGAAGGSGPVSGTGDVEICLVEPSPDEPDLPRLDLQMIDIDDEPGPFSFHQGDQGFVFVEVANNDLTNAVTLEFESEGNQAAGFADGNDATTAYDNGIFRISNADADVFPADFFFDDAPLPIDRLPGDPLSTDPGLLQTNMTLGPGEIAVFGIAINSFGACADGSCNERNVCAEGTFGDGTPAAGCTGFTYLVDNDLAPRYPGRTIEDLIKVDPEVDAQWSGLRLFDPLGNLIDETHGSNLPDNLRILPETGIQTTGLNLQGPFNSPFPEQWTERITVPAPVAMAQYDLFIFDQRDNFAQQHNLVTIHGLEGQTAPCPIPAISFIPGNFADLRIDFNSDGACGPASNVDVFLMEQGIEEHLFGGTLADLEVTPGFKVDPPSCRTLTFPNGDLLGGGLLVPNPPLVVENVAAADPFERIIAILDQLDNPADFTAQLDGPPGATLGTVANGEVVIDFDPDVLASGLNIHSWSLTIENSAFLNSPLTIPIRARRLPSPTQLPAPDFLFDAPPLAQAGGSYEAHLSIPLLDPDPGDPFFNMEVFISIETDDPLVFRLPDGSPFDFTPIDPFTPADELDRLRGKFVGGDIDQCSTGTAQCAKIEFGDGFSFDTAIFVDGFESGDVSAWSTGAAADNAVRTDREVDVGVLDADEKLPVITEEELRIAIELFNDDVVFDEKTIGLVSERFGVTSPLPPIQGTYFFDEFESFRKGQGAALVALDGSGCPAPCSGLVFEAGGGAHHLIIENFPDYGVEVRSDGVVLTTSIFDGNGLGGLLIEGSGTVVGGSEAAGNTFEDHGGPGIVVRSGTGNAITHNTFRTNDGLAIDLGEDGVTANDAGDADTGANGLQNFPVLTQALSDGPGSMVVEGTLDAAASTAFTLQFFRNDACHASGFGEGDVFLDEAAVTTGADGMATFAFTIAEGVSTGQYVTATATHTLTGDTSEFSACFEVTSGVATEDVAEVPTAFALYPAYPNPFNPRTTLRLDVPQAGPVRLTVYDALGRMVARLLDGPMAAGRHEIAFDAHGLPSGTYLYRMEGAGFAETRVLVLVK